MCLRNRKVTFALIDLFNNFKLPGPKMIQGSPYHDKRLSNQLSDIKEKVELALEKSKEV